MSALPISELFSSAPPSVIKSVQRGVLNMSGGETTKTVTLTAVNVAKTVTNLLGVCHGNAVAGTTALGVHHLVHLVLTDGSTLTATRLGRPDAAAFAAIQMSYEVVEYN